jgi:hypothetical protein
MSLFGDESPMTPDTDSLTSSPIPKIEEEEEDSKKEKKDFVLQVNNCSKLASHFSKYFDNSELSDVSFEVEGKKIMAHKFVLASRRF